MEAKNLENKDVSFIVKDKSDPYCELQLGSQLFKTKTINNNLDPKFNEYFEAVVDQAVSQFCSFLHSNKQALILVRTKTTNQCL